MLLVRGAGLFALPRNALQDRATQHVDRPRYPFLVSATATSDTSKAKDSLIISLLHFPQIINPVQNASLRASVHTVLYKICIGY